MNVCAVQVMFAVTKLKFYYCFICLFVFTLHNPATDGLSFGQPPSENDDIYRMEDRSVVWQLPKGCSSDCRLVEWSTLVVEEEEMIEFSVRSPVNAGYLAIAISLDTVMGTLDDVYVCARSSSESEQHKMLSGYLVGHQPPVLNQTMEESHFVSLGPYVKCTFKRPLLVIRKIDEDFASWDLAINNYNILYAEGEVNSDGDILRHTFRAATSQPFDLFRTDRYPPFQRKVPPEESIEPRFSSSNMQLPSQQKSSFSVPVHNLDDIEAESGSLVSGSWYVPNENCTNKICKSVHWQLYTGENEEDNYVQFSITGSSRGWIAIAISRDNAMGDDDCYICSRIHPTSQDLILTSALITGTVAPTHVNENDNTVLIHDVIIQDLMGCDFRRPISVTKAFNGSSTTWDLSNETFHFLFAEGSVDDEGQLIPHTFSRYTHGPLYFLSNDGYKKAFSQRPDNPDPIEPSTPNSTLFETERLNPDGGGYIWVFPADCTTDCRMLQWKPFAIGGKPVVQFFLDSPVIGYSGFLITDDLQKQQEGDISTALGECYFCYLKSPDFTNATVGKGNCDYSHTPMHIEEVSEELGQTFDSKPKLDVLVKSFYDLGEEWLPEASVSAEGILSCSFMRPIKLNVSYGGEVVDHDLSKQSYFIIYGEGEVETNGKMKSVNNSAVLSEPLLMINLNVENLREKFINEENETEDGSKSSVVSTVYTAIDNAPRNPIFPSTLYETSPSQGKSEYHEQSTPAHYNLRDEITTTAAAFNSREPFSSLLLSTLSVLIFFYLSI